MAKGITEDQIKYTIELSSSKAQQELHKMGMQHYVEPFPNYNAHCVHYYALFRVKWWMD